MSEPNRVIVSGQGYQYVLRNHNDLKAVVVDTLELGATGKSLKLDGELTVEGSFSFRVERESHARGEHITYIGELYPGVQPGEEPDATDDPVDPGDGATDEVGDWAETMRDKLRDDEATDDTMTNTTTQTTDTIDHEHQDMLRTRLESAESRGDITGHSAEALYSMLDEGSLDEVERLLDAELSTSNDAFTEDNDDAHRRMEAGADDFDLGDADLSDPATDAPDDEVSDDA